MSLQTPKSMEGRSCVLDGTDPEVIKIDREKDDWDSTPLKGSGPGRDSIELLFSETQGDDDLIGGNLVGTPVGSALTPVDRAKFGDNADYMVYLEQEVKHVSRPYVHQSLAPSRRTFGFG